MSNINVVPCTPQEALAILIRVFRMPVGMRPTPMLHGEPGIGKSAIVRQAAEAVFGPEAAIIDCRLSMHEASDIKGLPDMDRAGDKVRWIKPDFLPREGRGVLFLDELTQARRDTMAAVYPVVLDRKIDDLEIPEGYVIVAAGNDVADGAIANAMGTALADRMLHLLVQATPESFVAYWESRGMHPAILAMMTQMPHLHSNNSKRIEEDLMVSPTSRSYERANKLLSEFEPKDMSDKDQLRMLRIILSGCIGMESAGHLEMTMADIAECADPRTLLALSGKELEKKLPKTFRASIALAFAFGHVCKDAASLTKACMVMTKLGELANGQKVKATEGAIDMSGRELAALGIERLLRKAADLKLTDDILDTPREGRDELLAYLEDVGERTDKAMRRARSGALSAAA